MIKIVLPKGRLLKDVVSVFESLGIPMSEVEKSRKLYFEYPSHGFYFVIAKPFDVITYVKEGVVDAGIVGNDVIEEMGADLYEPIDLGIGKCKMVVAQRRDFVVDSEILVLKVATKYPRITERHYGKKGIPLEVIPMYGSVELAAVCGLAHQIVDLVETGRTLKENNLVEVEKIMDVSARLVVNRSSYKLKAGRINEFLNSLRKVLIDKGMLGKS